MNPKGMKPGQDIRRRVSQQRAVKAYCLIVCEGQETERNYFYDLKRSVNSRWNVRIQTSRSKSPEEVVKKAVRCREDVGDDWDESRDEAWCILDVEGPQNRRRLLKAIAVARQEGIHICLSNPCFEVWLLAHFVQTAQHFLNANAAIRELNKHWQRAFRVDYEKNYPQIFQRLGRSVEQAVENARSVWQQHPWPDDQPGAEDRNSCTQVFRLVERLLGPPDGPA